MAHEDEMVLSTVVCWGEGAPLLLRQGPSAFPGWLEALLSLPWSCWKKVPGPQERAG